MAIDKIFNDANVDGIADNIFGAVNNSVSEVKAMQQRKAAENVQMVVEAFKKIETNITEKFDNVTDVIEKRVLTIKDGRDGSSGSDGRNGRDGKPGRDGVNGKQGTPGTPGKDGVDGEDGVSVTDANIDFDGSLVISLSSGQQINVGEVVAPDLAEKIKIVSTMSTNGAVGIKDEGTSITAGVKVINFVGATVTATNSGDDVTVNVSAGTGTVTSVAATVPAFLSVAGSPITTTGTLAISLSGTALPVANGGTGLTTGTSGGVLAYTAAGTLASSTALAASALVIGGGAGAAPSTTTTGTGVVTALGVNVGTAGAFVVNGGALGSPSSVGTMPAFTLGGTVSGGGNQINNVIIGTTGAAAGNFTTVNTSGIITITIPGTGIPTNLAVNTTAGAANGMSIEARADESSGIRLVQTSTTYNTSPVGASDPPNIASAGTLVSGRGGGLNIVGANGPVRTYSGGAGTATTSVSSTGLAVTGTLSATGTLSGGTSGTGYSFSGSAPATSLTLNSSGQLTVGTNLLGGEGLALNGNGDSGDGVSMVFKTLGVSKYRIGRTAAIIGGASNELCIQAVTGLGMNFYVNGSTQAAVIDSAGNLGLGVTPSAWVSTRKAFQIGVTGCITNNSGNTLLGENFYTDSTPANIYLANGFATAYQQTSGEHRWLNAASGTAGNSISFTQAMTLDASGNLLVGGTSQSATANRTAVFSANKFGLSIIDTTAQATGVGGALNLGGNYRTTGDAQAFARVSAVKQNSTDNDYGYGMAFSVTPNGGTFTEAARIDSSGFFKARANGGAYFGGSNNQILNNNNTSGDVCLLIGNAAGNATNNTSSYSLISSDNSGDRLYIYGNGNVVNINNSYGTLSDVKLKENIVDATPKLDDVMRLQVRNFNLKSNPELKQIGFVAQELEQIFPALIDESPDRDAEGNITEEMTKSIKTSVLVPILVKAIQEQQALITQLTARITALETA